MSAVPAPTTDIFVAPTDEGLDPRVAGRFWTDFYVDGVPVSIDDELAAAGTMVDLFVRESERYAAREGFVSLGTGYTYGAMLGEARAFAVWLQSVGVQPGERVALMMPNCLQYPAALFGTLIAGAVVANVNPLYSPRELKHQINDAGAVAIVVMDLFAATVAAVRDEMPTLRHIVVTGMGGMLSPLKGAAITLATRRQVKPYRLPGALGWRAVMRRARGKAPTPVAITPDDLAFLQYTGGTSGVAKGAMLTHRNVVANVLQSRAWIVSQLDRDEQLTNITLLPLYHIYSLTANLLSFVGIGGRNVLIANPRDVARVEWILRKEKFASFSGVNTLFVSLMENEKFAGRDFSALKLTGAGGMATHADVARRWQAMTGRPLVEGYGLTECSPVVTISPVDLAHPDAMRHSGRVGLPVPSTEVRMRRDDGRWAAIGEQGELCVRGPQVMKGYWQRPQETAKILSADGWLATGDVGVMDEEGQVRLVDRIKDLIVVSGFNVYPSEVESVIADHPKVAEVGVIGIADDVKGEQVKAVVVRRNPSLTEAELRDFVRERLTNYKRPAVIRFRDEPLPKSEVGKILRRVLRDEDTAE